MSRAASSGSRARSREIGYGDAMLEMSQVLAGMRRGLEAMAQLDDTGVVERLELLAAARAYKRVERYAFNAWEMLASYHDATFARDAEHREYLEREGLVQPARRELPQREHHESN